MSHFSTFHDSNLRKNSDHASFSTSQSISGKQKIESSPALQSLGSLKELLSQNQCCPSTSLRGRREEGRRGKDSVYVYTWFCPSITQLKTINPGSEPFTQDPRLNSHRWSRKAPLTPVTVFQSIFLSLRVRMRVIYREIVLLTVLLYSSTIALNWKLKNEMADLDKFIPSLSLAIVEMPIL